jgi:CHAT domain-containing protein/Tfp pilus assembly protein PilF
MATNSGPLRTQQRHAARSSLGTLLIALALCCPVPAAQDAERLAAEAADLARVGTPESLRSAIDAYERVLDVRRAAGDARGQAAAHFAIASAFEKLGEFAAARDRYAASLRLYTEVDDRRGQADAGLNAGVMCYLAGEPRIAIDYLVRALPHWRAVGDPRGEARTASNLGVANYALGDLHAALDWYARALPLRRAAGDSAGEAGTLHNIGLTHIALGEPQKALEHVSLARALSHASGDRFAESSILNTMGMMSTMLGEQHQALEYFGRALAIARARNLAGVEAAALQGLGTARAELGEYEAALGHYLETMPRVRAAKVPRGTAGALLKLGRIYELLDRRADALAAFEEALALFRAVAEPLGEIPALVAIAEIHARDARGLAKAADAFAAALRVSKRVGDPNGEAAALAGLARVGRDGDLAEARTRVEAALAIVEARRTKLASPELRASYLGMQRGAYELYVDVLLRLHERDAGGGHLAEALEASERARARSLLDLLAEARVDVQAGLDPALKLREQRIEAHNSRIHRQLLQARARETPDAARVEELERELAVVDRDHRELEWEVRRANPRYGSLRYPEPLRADAIRRTLDAETALLQYVLGRDGSFLFVVTSDDVRAYRLPGVAEIAPLVAEARATLALPARGSAGRFARVARRLYDLLVAPAAAALGDKRLLLVAPDRDLHYLPFEVLLTEAPTGTAGGFRDFPYLLRRWAVAYVPSASVLADLRANRRGAEGGFAFVGFGDPVYTTDGRAGDSTRGLFDGGGRLELPRLEASGREITRIAERFPRDETAVYLGRDAREGNVKGNTRLESARRLHFAVHGVIDEKRPRYSGLALSLDDASGEDGLLQVHEIFNLKLGADLVVLSACGSGLGREVTGEGILGLTRAFLYAGASSVAVSLWQVSDRSTADLMVSFYELTERAPGKAEALRRAKLRMIEAGRDSHPFHWAPFILVGSPG